MIVIPVVRRRIVLKGARSQDAVLGAFKAQRDFHKSNE